jgi:UDP-N-acetylglucosamine transferase subunit ALG13
VIFVTIGSMFPFDRLVRAMDAWAAAHPGEEVLAQIGDGGFTPSHMRWLRRLDQDAFTGIAGRAEVIVAHAGMGSVITAGQVGTPIVVLPRQKDRGEHNTDHQLATARWLRGRPGVFVAPAEQELDRRIAEARAAADGRLPSLPPTAPPEFIARLRAGLEG